jgi:hypothetical protein
MRHFIIANSAIEARIVIGEYATIEEFRADTVEDTLTELASADLPDGFADYMLDLIPDNGR